MSRRLASGAEPQQLATESDANSSSSLLSTSSTLTPTAIPPAEPMRRPRSFQKLRWSLLDKKRVEAIVGDFGELNERIHENVKLWCLGTTVSVDLKHIANKGNSLEGHEQSLEMTDTELRTALRDAKKPPRSRSKFGVVEWGSESYLLEYRSYAPELPVTVELDSRTTDLVEKLARLRYQPKEIIFRTPNRRGWVRQTLDNEVAYVFAIPPGYRPMPVSLLDVLSSKSLAAPSLSERFWLALRLARCISQLQLVKCVHESFRSKNILFLPSTKTEAEMEGEDAPTASEQQLDYSEPWVLGFEFSRPELYFSNGIADACMSRDVYRHPDRQGTPTQVFSKIHDIYALRVVLLEIGLWQPAVSLEKPGFARVRDPHTIKQHLIRQAEKKLGSKMGNGYRDAVVRCLSGSFDVQGDKREDLKLQQAFRSDVVDVLQRAANSV